MKRGDFFIRILAAITGAGFAGCNIIVPCEYGCPHSDYIVQGTVTDEEGTPIKGIRVSRHEGDDNPSFTDGNGIFRDTLECMYLQYFLDDVDGEANGGKFASDTLYQTDFEMEKMKKGDGNWYEGQFDAKATVKLKKQ